MTIADSFKKAINSAFVYTIFWKRNTDMVLKALSTTTHGSDNMSVIPPIQGFKLEPIDETHDKATFDFDDYSFEGIITWKPVAEVMCREHRYLQNEMFKVNTNSYVFLSIE